jgi:hypothetical protein
LIQAIAPRRITAIIGSATTAFTPARRSRRPSPRRRGACPRSRRGLLLDGVEAERRPDGPLLEDDELGREGTRAEDEGEGVGPLGREVPLDDPVVGDLALDVRCRLDPLVEDDGELATDVVPRDPAELLGPLGVQEELDGRLVELVLPHPGVLQVAAGDGGGAVEHVEDGRPRARLGVLRHPFDELQVGRDRPAVGRLRGFGRRVRPPLQVDELELEKAGRADDVLDAGRVVDAGELDDDAVVPLRLDRRLGDTESVDAVSDGLDGLTQGLGLDLHPGRLAEGDSHLTSALVRLPVGRREGRLDEIDDRRGADRVSQRDRETLARRRVHGPDGDSALPRFGPQMLGGIRGFCPECVFGLHLHDEVDAAPEVQPELQAVLQDVGNRGIRRRGGVLL